MRRENGMQEGIAHGTMAAGISSLCMKWECFLITLYCFQGPHFGGFEIGIAYWHSI